MTFLLATPTFLQTYMRRIDPEYGRAAANLGATPLSELYGVYHRLAERCAEAGIIIERNLVGAYCTSLDMQGVSITLLNVDDELLSLWDAPVKTPALRWGC